MEYNEETDPCSFSYKRASNLRQYPQVVSRKGKSRRNFTVTVRKARMGFFRTFKNIFKSKTKSRNSFVMPHEFSKPPSTTESPRCSVNQIRASVMSMPVPSVCLTRPSLRHRRTSYRIHSYTGSGSPPSPRNSSVRFSHPVVSDFVVRPRVSATSSNGTANDIDESRRNNSTATEASDISADFTTDGDRKLRPETIWQVTSESVMTWSAFTERLDGHRPKSNASKISDRAPSLQCITRLPTIKLQEDIFQSPKHETAEKHRSDALKSLEGSWYPQGNDRYVLAVMPVEDLPITAVKIRPEQFPPCLIPGGQLAMLPRDHLPETATTVPTEQHPSCLLPGIQANAQPIAGPSAWKGKGKYRAYSGVFQEKTTPVAQSYSEIDLPRTPNMWSKDEFSKRHSEHYKRVESAIFDDDELIKPLHTRMSEVEFSKRHSAHYKRVESGIFDEDVLNNTSVPSPIPYALRPGNNATFLLPPIPPSTPNPRQSFQAYNPHHQAREVLPTTTPVSVPLLLAPQPRRMAPALKVSKVPSRVTMNADRYPFVFKHSEKHFSAEPKYQRRTIDYVEAKFRQERKSKEAKKEEKLAELRELDAQVKKLCLM